MASQLTYEELEQRAKELENEFAELKLTEKAFRERDVIFNNFWIQQPKDLSLMIQN